MLASVAMLCLARLLILLLIAAVPLQGAAAASRWLCVVGTHGPDVDAAHSHAAHSHGNAAHDGHHQAALGQSASIAADMHSAGADFSGGASPTCNLCAACCLTVAAPPAQATPVAMPASFAGFPPITPAVTDFVVHGPERPPRLA